MSVTAHARTARERADSELASGHAEGSARSRALRKWATAVGQAKRRESAGMLEDAGDAKRRAEHHRQHLADLGVEVPSWDDMHEEEAPAPSRGAPARRAPARSSSGGRPSPRTSRRSSSAPSLPSIPGASKAGSIAKPIVLGTIGMILLYRLVSTKNGGPGVFSMGVGGVSKALDLFLLPVDPFRPSAVTSSVTTPASSSSSAQPTATSAGAAVPGVPHH